MTSRPRASESHSGSEEVLPAGAPTAMLVPALPLVVRRLGRLSYAQGLGPPAQLVADRQRGLTGCWVGRDKIGAIGVRISRWVTSHGFAFNVANDLAPYSLIVPCGIPDRGVTTLQQLLARPVPLTDAQDALTRHFVEVFERH